ncbi:MAG: Cof-type HAD-IIB family hydrolase [Oscillospiraceae bacterium]|jgi:Cof subfamily protein (haloacid dehalogenase superfamily)|nr:Cof-type HAD-IIB family hydrolase [Oscillospiraceae bacterium]
MIIKLIAVDMDGTALKSDGTVSKRTMMAMQKAVERGIFLIPATGRVAKMLPQEPISIPGVRYAITSNGASLIDLRDHSTLYTDWMTMEESNRILRFFADYGLFTEAYRDGKSFSDRAALQRLEKTGVPPRVHDYIMRSQEFVDNLPGFIASGNIPLEKVNVPYVPDEFRTEIQERLRSMKEYSVSASGTENIEVNAASCSKGTALKYLCTNLCISPSQVMAVGDSGNDVRMLLYAGWSVAMGNSAGWVRSAADFITGTNDEDGLAYAIEKFALSGE